MLSQWAFVVVVCCTDSFATLWLPFEINSVLLFFLLLRTHFVVKIIWRSRLMPSIWVLRYFLYCLGVCMIGRQIGRLSRLQSHPLWRNLRRNAALPISIAWSHDLKNQPKHRPFDHQSITPQLATRIADETHSHHVSTLISLTIAPITLSGLQNQQLHWRLFEIWIVVKKKRLNLEKKLFALSILITSSRWPTQFAFEALPISLSWFRSKVNKSYVSAKSRDKQCESYAWTCRRTLNNSTTGQLSCWFAMW